MHILNFTQIKLFSLKIFIGKINSILSNLDERDLTPFDQLWDVVFFGGGFSYNIHMFYFIFLLFQLGMLV